MSISIRKFVLIALALAVAILVSVDDAFAQSDGAGGFVHTEPIEGGAALNDQPIAISIGVVQGALASVRSKGSLLNSSAAVLDERELGEIAPRIVAALGKAGQREDVTFAVFGKHGVFGEYSPATVTAGRVFVLGGQLNVIFGLVQSMYEDPSTHHTVDLKPGLRARSAALTRSIFSESGVMVDGRSDWLRFDISRLASLAKPASPVDGTQPREVTKSVDPAPQRPVPDDGHYRDIQSRLITLDRLKADGLITEDEYRERRRAVLQSL